MIAYNVEAKPTGAFYLINDKETTQSNIERKDFSNGVNSTG